MKRGTPEHPKTLDLSEAIHAYLTTAGVTVPTEMVHTYACGLLERLWHFTARYAPSGLVATHSAQRIARAIGWSFEPDWLVRTMTRVGFFDDVDGCGLTVHDWHQHSDDAADKWLCDKGLTYANGKPPRRRSRPGRDKSRRSRDKSRQSEPSSEPSSSSKPPPPNAPQPDTAARLRRELEEEVFGCGVEDARRCVGKAIEAGCSAAEIRQVITAWARRGGELGPGSLHYRLMDLKPGENDPERGWPKAAPEVAAKKHAAKVADRERSTEEEHAKKVAADMAVAEARERRFGDELDMMDRAEVEAIVKHNPSMHQIFKKKQPSPLLRAWLLVQLEKRAEILS